MVFLFDCFFDDSRIDKCLSVWHTENQEDSHKRWCLAKRSLPFDICFAANGKLRIACWKYSCVCRGRFVHVCFAENQLVQEMIVIKFKALFSNVLQIVSKTQNQEF